jgi:hypothetical protein
MSPKAESADSVKPDGKSEVVQSKLGGLPSDTNEDASQQGQDKTAQQEASESSKEVVAIKREKLTVGTAKPAVERALFCATVTNEKLEQGCEGLEGELSKAKAGVGKGAAEVGRDRKGTRYCTISGG